jgi:hypothetical protein
LLGAPYYYPYYAYPYSYPYYPSDVLTPTVPLYSPPVVGECRAFQGNAVFTGTPQPFYGTACFGADGRWHVVN